LDTSKITLASYSDEYIEGIKDYMLPQEQYLFTSYPLEVLEQGNQEYDKFPVLILHNGKVVGFFCLYSGKRVAEVTTNDRALLLTSFSINYKYQKRGFAKQALYAISGFIKETFAEMNEVVLVVNMRNIPAQSLYNNCGFKDQGERRIGKKGEQMVLHLEI
jgi:ribosomal protein S18 acetylase RimI-like enzyme